jgi:membrane protein implicated in regulation of membrane protease activity
LALLLASRASLVRIEARDAANIAAHRLLLGVGFALCAFFVWALLLAGGIAAIADACPCPWYWLALGTALLHLLAAVILAKLASKPLPPTFPFTRAEFQKDREWIQKL